MWEIYWSGDRWSDIVYKPWKLCSKLLLIFFFCSKQKLTTWFIWGFCFQFFCYSAWLTEWSSVADELPEPPLRLPHGDRAFCLSPPKMALAFGVLGLVFVCAVAVALYTLLRGRHHHYHSKVHLGEETLIVQDSPFMGHRIQWPHIRVMHWWNLFCLCTVSSHEITPSQDTNGLKCFFIDIIA